VNSNDYASDVYPGSCCGFKEINQICANESLLNKELGCFGFILDAIYKHIYINSAFVIGFLCVEVRFDLLVFKFA
jgi:hypothetical protein